MRKIILIILWICILAIIPIVVFKFDEKSFENDIPYISSMVGVEILDIEMKVNRDNSIDVTESITFNLVEDIPFDGITVNFPLRDNLFKRRNLSVSNIKSDDISVNEKKRVHNVEAALGSELEDLEPGFYTYTLNYHYDLGKDNDDFIYKVFANKYNIDIFTMNVAVSFEEGIDQNKVKFFSGGEDVTNHITFGVEDNVVRAYASDYIMDQDLTIEVDLDNYFKNKKSTDGYIAIILLVIMSILTIVLVILNILEHASVQSLEEHYMIDMRSIPKLLGIIVIEAFTYLFINDLNVSMYFLYYITYGIIFLSGLILILKLKTK